MSHLSSTYVCSGEYSGGCFLTVSKRGLSGDIFVSMFASRSQEGKGVEGANELPDGDANTIGPNEAGVAGDGGESDGESAISILKLSKSSVRLLSGLKNFWAEGVTCGKGTWRDTEEGVLNISEPLSAVVGKTETQCRLRLISGEENVLMFSGALEAGSERWNRGCLTGGTTSLAESEE